jgi:hypothetical protein
MKNNLLRGVSATGMLLLPLPLILMLDCAAFEHFDFLRYVFYFLTAIPAILSGYILQKIKNAQNEPKKILLVNIIKLITLIIMFTVLVICTDKICTASNYSFFSTYINFAMMPSIGLWFLLGMKLNKKSFSDIFTPLWLCIFLIETFLCHLFCFFLKADHPMMTLAQSVMTYLVIIMALIVALLINQSNIETQINQRKNTNLIVPKGLKSYNAGLITIVGGIILFAMLFKDFFAGIIWWFVKFTITLIDTILQLIKLETSDPITPDGLLPDSPGIGIQQNGFDISIYIFAIVTIILIIVFRKKIFSFFRDLISRLIGRFSQNEEENTENENYTDYYEVINNYEKNENPETSSDCLKRYKKEKDDTEKYRLGYRLYMMWLAKRNKGMNSTLTVEQQKFIAERTYHGDSDIKEIAESYTEIRYNDKKADSDSIVQMEELIKELYN